MRIRRRAAAVFLTCGLALIACSTDGRTLVPPATTAPVPTAPSVTTGSSADTAVPLSLITPASEVPFDIAALDAGATADAFTPLQAPTEPGGRIGFDRYVYVRAGAEVIPALVEGPRGAQVRCQQEALPCSYEDLRDLHDSGAEIPVELGLDAAQLEALVGELGAVEAALATYADPNAACAAGYEPDRTQTANMGSHFTSDARIRDGVFDPAEPEIVLYALAADAAPDGPLGRCRGGEWVGEEVTVVGAAFFQPRVVGGNEHVAGFTGDLDNWHIHYNLCRLAGRDVTVPPSSCAESGVPNGPPNEPRGEASEGWMIHAWAVPGRDNQLGVFSMWNPQIWPIAAPAEVRNRAAERATAAGTEIIADFVLPSVEARVGETVRFFNADDVGHTVTAGVPDAPDDLFDTGAVGGHDLGEITLAQPGTFDYFCTIHPEMRATITVQ